VVSITICCPEWRTSSILECRLLYIKIWSIWLCVLPSIDVQLTLWILPCGNIVLLTVGLFHVAKLVTLTPLLLLISCQFPFPIVGLKISSLSTFELKSLIKFLYGTSGIYQIPVLVLQTTCPIYHQFYLQFGHEHSAQWYYTSDLLILCTTSYH
jgi:hypothetical protein